MDITESRLGVGRKSHHRRVIFRAGGVNALRIISLLARRRLGTTKSRLLFLRTNDEFTRRGLGDGDGESLSKFTYFSPEIDELLTGEGW
ncbi:hypothetical protein L1987_84999 [Smallanthus sonchifolius]|uniref:Uncharacterized protein n=1 Tax=Smallanthus sonchifolius TaxID=185202 RepID=A0ACB8XWX0_9ASTR|nr:hypothetical protein L1987_84999 [Smallanthus sonchifolius]